MIKQYYCRNKYEPSKPKIKLTRWCLHLNVVGEFDYFRDPESYAGGSVATGRDTQAGQGKG